MSAAAARWDGFLNQIRERFVQIMQEAQQGCPALLEQAGFDPVPMGNAWGAMELRAKQLESKVSDTWSQQVESTLEREGTPHGVLALACAKGDALRDWMETERERTRIGIFANAGRAMFERALGETGRTFACSRCGAPIDVPFTFRALNFPCPHCRTINGFEPGTRMRAGEMCVHPLCEEASWSQWLAMRAAEKARDEARPVTIHHLKTHERAMLAYWHVYLTTRARLMPDTASAYDADIRGKMRSFYEMLDREGAWVDAGRPRELV
jgi:hypothetical protein